MGIRISDFGSRMKDPRRRLVVFQQAPSTLSAAEHAHIVRTPPRYQSAEERQFIVAAIYPCEISMLTCQTPRADGDGFQVNRVLGFVGKMRRNVFHFHDFRVGAGSRALRTGTLRWQWTAVKHLPQLHGLPMDWVCFLWSAEVFSTRTGRCR